MNTIEGNKLIAEFMGAKKNHANIGSVYTFKEPPTKHSSYKWDYFAMEYHTSWDWLMPCCKKWDNLEISDDEWDEYERRCDLLDSIITSTWDCNEAFVQLSENIQWYNNQTQTHQP